MVEYHRTNLDGEKIKINFCNRCVMVLMVYILCVSHANHKFTQLNIGVLIEPKNIKKFYTITVCLYFCYTID